jgi:hypothetical protein
MAICLAVGPSHSSQVDFTNQVQRIVEFKLLHTYRTGTERVGRDDVGSNLTVLSVDLSQLIWVGQCQNIGKVLDILVMAGKPFSAHGGFVQLQALNHRSHGTIEHQNAIFQGFINL